MICGSMLRVNPAPARPELAAKIEALKSRAEPRSKLTRSSLAGCRASLAPGVFQSRAPALPPRW